MQKTPTRVKLGVQPVLLSAWTSTAELLPISLPNADLPGAVATCEDFTEFLCSLAMRLRGASSEWVAELEKSKKDQD